MLDPQLLRSDIDAVARRLAARSFVFDVAAFQAIEGERKRVQTRAQELQATRNQFAKRIGQAKARGEDVSGLTAEATRANSELADLERHLESVQIKLQDLLLGVPNLPHESVPVGKSSEDNVEVRRLGSPKEFGFALKDHVDLGAGLKMLDFDAAGKIAGARFALMKGPLARLHRAAAQFMLDVHTQEHGYTEVYAPYMVTGACADAPSSLAKFKDDLFKIEGRDLYLIPTAEYPVTNMVRES